MKPPLRFVVIGSAFAAVGLSLFCLHLWQPDRQARLHTTHLLKAFEDRDYSRMKALIDDVYSDRWGFKKATLIRDAREVLRQFFAPVVTGTLTSVEERDRACIVSVRLKLDGSGTGLAEVAKDRVNQLSEPFVLEWRRRSWKPWDWQLVRADQPQLRVTPQEFDSSF